MRAVVVINPIAGPARRSSLQARTHLAQTVLGRHGYAVTVRVTGAAADTPRFARESLADGADLVIAWGGDGTVNGVGSVLCGSHVPLGIVPGGSGNGLARDLRLPSGASRALEVAASGATRTIDAGEVHGALFFNVAGVGLDASIAARLAQPGVRRGLTGYLTATLGALREHRPATYTLALIAGPPRDTAFSPQTVVRRALFIALANSTQYGQGARIAPLAELDDGALDVVVVEPQPALRIAARVPALFLGTLSDGPGILMRRASQLTIAADGAIPFHVDGEPREGASMLHVRVHSRVLHVRVAAG